MNAVFQWIAVGLILAYALWRMVASLVGERKRGRKGGGCGCGCNGCGLKDACAAEKDDIEKN